MTLKATLGKTIPTQKRFWKIQITYIEKHMRTKNPPSTRKGQMYANASVYGTQC